MGHGQRARLGRRQAGLDGRAVRRAWAASRSTTRSRRRATRSGPTSWSSACRTENGFPAEELPAKSSGRFPPLPLRPTGGLGDNAGLMSRLLSKPSSRRRERRADLAAPRRRARKTSEAVQQGRGEGALQPRHVVLRSRPLRRGDHGVRGRLPAEERSGVPVQPGAVLPAGRQTRAGGPLLQDVPALRAEGAEPRRHRREDQERGAAGRATGGRNDLPPPATTTPPPVHDDAAAREHAAAARQRAYGARFRRRPTSCRPSTTPPVTATAARRPSHRTDPIRAASSASRGWRPPAWAPLMCCSASTSGAAPSSASHDIEAAARNGRRVRSRDAGAGPVGRDAARCCFVLGTLAIGAGRRPLVLRTASAAVGDDDLADRARALPRARTRAAPPSGSRSDDANLPFTRPARGRAVDARRERLRLQPEPGVGNAGVRPVEQLPGGLHLHERRATTALAASEAERGRRAGGRGCSATLDRFVAPEHGASSPARTGTESFDDGRGATTSTSRRAAAPRSAPFYYCDLDLDIGASGIDRPAFQARTCSADDTLDPTDQLHLDAAVRSRCRPPTAPARTLAASIPYDQARRRSGRIRARWTSPEH